MSGNVTEETLRRDGYSIAELASRYGVSEGLVRLEIARGRLKSARIGRRVVIPKSAIEHWLSASQRHA
jgi:excisionase family DNA binding protein